MENLHEWSLKMQGAREMLEKLNAMQQHGMAVLNVACEGKLRKEDKVYSDAIIRLALSSLDNTAKFLMGRQPCYCNDEKDKKGKLIKCDAYFE